MTRDEYAALLNARAPEFSFTDNNDVAITRLGLSITLFFKQGYTLEKREKILHGFRRFRQEFGSHLRFHRHEFKGMRKYSEDTIAKVETRILTKGIYDYGGWVISDARNADEAPHYLMHYLDSREAQGENTNFYLSLQLPWDFLTLENGPQRFHDWLIFLCQQLEPDSGDCGYCLSLPNDYHEYLSIEYELAKRYPALQVNSTVHMTTGDYIDAIRSVNWFTILSERYVKRLGGETWIRNDLATAPDITVEPCNHGLIIRAGEYPDLTPLSEGLSDSYQRVNQLIRPVRVPPAKIYSLHIYGVNHFTVETSVQWYARYDREPLTVTPLQAGTPARVSGYWSNPDQQHRLLFMAQGSMAPDLPGAAPGTTWWTLHSEAASLSEPPAG